MSNSLFSWILFLFSSFCCQGASLSEILQAKVPRGRTESCWVWAMGRKSVREWRISTPPHKKPAFCAIKLHSPEKWKPFVVLVKFKNSILFMNYVFGFLCCFFFSVSLWFFGGVLVFCGFWFACLRVLFSWKMQILPSVKNAAQQISQSLLSLVFWVIHCLLSSPWVIDLVPNIHPFKCKFLYTQLLSV